MKIPQGDFGQQKRFALEHIKDKLWYSGSSVDKIGKVNKYVDHLPEFDEVNEICREFFGPDYTTWSKRTTAKLRLPRHAFQ